MAKLGKVKFSDTGHNQGRTTSKGDIELYLYYDMYKDCFYFDHKEIKLIFPEWGYWDSYFDNCNTKGKAITYFQTFLKNDLPRKKFLKLRISVPSDCLLGVELKEFTKQIVNEGSWLSVECTRVMRIGEGDAANYTECDADWVESKYTRKLEEDFLIEWDEETEIFIKKFKDNLYSLSKNIVEYFNMDKAVMFKNLVNNQRLILTTNG